MIAIGREAPDLQILRISRPERADTLVNVSPRWGLSADWFPDRGLSATARDMSAFQA